MLRLPNISLSRVQTIVGLTAGILSIGLSLVAVFKPASDKAELVAIVQDSKTDKAISDAMIEVLTQDNSLITTLRPDWRGKVSYKLVEGHYRLRVSHPKYRADIRDVQLISKESTEVRVQLRGGTALDSVRKVFRH